jgi:hypothetical protein
MPRREEHPGPEEVRREASEIEQERKGSEEGKSPHEVAGKKAAAARKEQGTRRSKGSRDEE